MRTVRWLYRWGRRSVERYFARGGARMAAAIAYYVLLSLFPLVIILVAIAGLVLDDEELRADFVGALTDALPFTESGASDVADAVDGVVSNAGTVGLVSIPLLVWSAGGMMTAIRLGLDAVIDGGRRRPFPRGKLLDLVMLLVLAVLLIGIAAASVVAKVARESVIAPGGGGGLLLEVGEVVFPMLLGGAVLWALLTWVATDPPPVRVRAAGAAAGGVALWALSLGFAEFVGRFGSYNVVYGSLAAVVVFLVYVYALAAVILMTASAAVEFAPPSERPVTTPEAATP